MGVGVSNRALKRKGWVRGIMLTEFYGMDGKTL